jgi:hypothetical protein
MEAFLRPDQADAPAASDPVVGLPPGGRQRPRLLFGRRARGAPWWVPGYQP